jgi:hypothetical protein
VDLSEEMESRVGAEGQFEGALETIRRDKKREEGRRLQVETSRAQDSGDEAKEVEALRKYMEAKGIKKRGK